ncbi:MAG: hypothetical protein AUK44_06000 [Porphyromonadaceae bacterium CG2_30_38_12]|nr:MAG: hypothetical protein AUK44_06000 [Porphyromonadaceae bacterium CG2_30_38_12]
MKQTLKDIVNGILNSYSIIFFLDNKILSGTLLVVSFLNFWAGVSGLLAVVFVLYVGKKMNLHQPTLQSGYYSFNALLVGLGMGTFFDPSVVYFSLLALASLLSLLLSVGLGGWFYKYKLPFLSIPFVITFWFVVLPSSHFENLGLTQRSIFWINELYAVGGNGLLELFKTIDSFQVHQLVDIYLRSLSSIFFQSNLIAGTLIAIALLISSRIMFSLSVVGFLSAYFFAQFTGSEAASINYYNIGANYMMVAFAIGGFFAIPSRQSYLWTILLIPLTSLVLLFFYKLLGFIQLPVFSLPFSFVTILFVYFLQMRTKAENLVLTPLQLNSPEQNLYTYRNNVERLSGIYYFAINLPFIGEWTVTQAHNGKYTHKGEWRHAFDFMITDSNNSTFRNDGYQLTDYYCYNKPIFAPADGFVELILDNIEDNIPGQVNTVNNWGNSIVIRHLNGLYSQISHLRKGTFKVQQGAFIHKGDLLAHCGNSGRSPEPHIHFQMQIFPAIGAKTIDYPFAYFYKTNSGSDALVQYKKPQKGDIVAPVSSDQFMFNAFNILPDSVLNMKYSMNGSNEKMERWDTYTDAYNQKYFFCAETNSTAYYINDGSMFYFTAFYGNKNSLLYYFYLAAFKIYLGNKQIEIQDYLPLSVLRIPLSIKWLHDFVAPFKSFIKVEYQSAIEFSDNALNSGEVRFASAIKFNMLNKINKVSESTVKITSKGLTEFEYKSKKTQIKARCISI